MSISRKGNQDLLMIYNVYKYPGYVKFPLHRLDKGSMLTAFGILELTASTFFEGIIRVCKLKCIFKNFILTLSSIGDKCNRKSS